MESLRRDRQRQQEESAKTSEQLIKVFTECMEDKVLLNVKVEKSMTRKVAFTRAATLMGQLKTSGRNFGALIDSCYSNCLIKLAARVNGHEHRYRFVMS